MNLKKKIVVAALFVIMTRVNYEAFKRGVPEYHPVIFGTISFVIALAQIFLVKHMCKFIAKELK